MGKPLAADEHSTKTCLQEAASLRTLAARLPEGSVKAEALKIADEWERTAEKFGTLIAPGVLFKSRPPSRSFTTH